MNQSLRAVLVDGYIHEIQSLLAKDIIIPTEIIELCYLFSNNPQQIFITLSHDNKKSLMVLDIDNKKMSKVLSLHTDLIRQYMS